MSWKQNASLKEAVVGMQPEPNFDYQQIELEEHQRQYFHRRKLAHTNATDDTARRSTAMNEKLALMDKIQQISHTKPRGERANLSDWDNYDNVEAETIGMMRHFGMCSMAYENVDKNSTLPVTVPTDGVYISNNGKFKIPILLGENYFRSHQRKPLAAHTKTETVTQFDYQPSSSPSTLNRKFNNPRAQPLPDNSEKDNQSSIQLFYKRMQEENMSPIPNTYVMVDEPQQSVISKSKTKDKALPSALNQLNPSLQRNSVIRRPLNCPRLNDHLVEQRNSLVNDRGFPSTNQVKTCNQKSCRNMENEKNRTAINDSKSKNPEVVSRKTMLSAWASAAATTTEKKSTASNGV